MRSISRSSLIICVMLSACDDHYFDQPQPIDSKSSYSIPNKYIGTWYTDQNKLSTITIGKDFYTVVHRSEEEESRAKLDLDTNAYFIGNKLYFKENKELREYDYVIVGDSVRIDVVEVDLVELGQSAFIRELDHGYILNKQHEQMNNWWNIRFIDTRNKEGVVIREIGNEDLNENYNHTVLHEDLDKYIIAKWTKNDLEKFIDSGGFSDTLLFLKYADRIKD